MCDEGSQLGQVSTLLRSQNDIRFKLSYAHRPIELPNCRTAFGALCRRVKPLPIQRSGVPNRCELAREQGAR